MKKKLYLFSALLLSAVVVILSYHSGGGPTAETPIAARPASTIATARVDEIARPVPIVGAPAKPNVAPDAAPNPTGSLLVRFSNATVLESRETAVSPGLKRRETLIQRSSGKYPLLRIEESILVDKETNQERVGQAAAMVADHVLVRPLPGETEKAFADKIASAGGTVRSKLRLSGNVLVSFSNANLDTVAQGMQRLGASVRLAEPDYIVFPAALPNDTRVSELWGMHNTGQTGGTPDADIDANEAWGIHQGSRSVVVGVIDTGIDYNHADLAANIWTNPGETADNNIDDDNNGFIDDVHGWDFANNDSNPMDDDGHGTRCAGTIGAVGDNGVGVAGVCWQVSMAALKFLQSGSGSTSDAIEAISYATNKGFFMTSNSWGGGGFSQALLDAIEANHTAGAVFVAAAGNSASDNDATPHYPASYRAGNIISVAATDHSNQLATFSNFGVSSVDLAAPGAAILSTVLSQQYQTYDSTSMAAAHVAGACALLKSYKSALTGAEIKDIILSSVDPLPALSGKMVTGGRLNAHRSLLGADQLTVSVGDFSTAGLYAGPFAPSSGSYTLTNHTTHSINWNLASTAPWLSFSVISGTLAAGASEVVTFNVTSLAETMDEGDYAATVVFTNTTDNHDVVRNARLRVGQRDYFTEVFDSSPNDLDYTSYIFTPTSGRNRYVVQRSGITALPVDPLLGSALFLGDDESLSLQLSRNFALFGRSYSRVFINANGNLTFSGASSAWRESLEEHFQVPRISMLLTDLVPSSGIIRRLELNDRLVISYLSVARYGSTAPNTFQVELFFDGRIRLSYLDIGETRGLVGLSEGAGLQPDFRESDFSEYNPNTGALALPVSAVEGAGVLATAGRITLSQPAASARTATITSLTPSLLSVPATVSIPQGSRSVSFPVTVENDSLANGSRVASIRVEGAAVQPITASMTIHDDETSVLTLTAPGSAQEGDGTFTATVSVPTALAVNVDVALSSSHQHELRVPAAVTLLAGQTSASFTVQVGDDSLLDGTQSVRLDASVGGWTTGSSTVNVMDNDVRTFSLALPTSLNENDTGILGAVNLGSQVASDVTVLLSSSHPRVIVPSSVIVRAGTSSTSFAVTISDDSLPLGNFSSTISASTPPGLTAMASVSIIDDEPASFRLSTILDQYLRTPFTVVIEALDSSNQVKTSFRDTVTLSAVSAGFSGVITPVVSPAFTNGVATVSVQMETQGLSTITATHTSGASGTSNTFTVLPSRPDFTTELFDFSNPDDLDFMSFTFRPDGTSYRVVRQSNVTAYPVPLKALGFSMGDDQSTPRTLKQPIRIFGVPHTQMHIGSNGYVTFGDDDTTYSVSLSNHFSKPRIAAAFGDLDPRDIYPISGGKIYYEEMADRVVVTWDKVPQFARRTAISSIQLELYYTGVIRITHLDVQMDRYLIGLSNGTGIPAGFFSSDFTNYPETNLVLSVPQTQFVEGDAPVVGRVSLGHDSGGKVTLSASPTGDFTFPASVTVPPGSSFSTFNLAVVNDSLLEGPQRINLTAAYLGRKSIVPLDVTEDTETATLFVSDAPDGTEGGPPLTFTLTSSAAAVNAVTVQLTASDPSILQVPSTVIMPAGKRSVTFKGVPLDDQRAGGTRVVSVAASVPQWTSGSGLVRISDNDVAQVVIDPIAPITENNASVPITIRLTSRNEAGTNITLTNSHPGRLSIPELLFLPAGEQSISITGLTLDDTVSTGDFTVTISASAPDHISATTGIMLLEDEASGLTVTPVTPQRARYPFQVLVQAVDGNGNILRGFNGNVTVTASNTGGAVAAQLISGSMSGGLGSLLLSVNEAATVVTLTFTCNGQTVSSNPFDVTAGPLDFYTETFVSPKPVDIQNTSFTFTPRPSPVAGHEYEVVRHLISQLPTPPTGGAALSLSDTAPTAAIDLAPGTPIALFGTNYTTIQVSKNGFIGFTAGETRTGPLLADHFVAPRISAFFNSQSGGTVSYKTLTDRLAISWENSIVAASTATNTFQVELFFDGRIRLSYLKLGGRGTVGLSRGGGTPVGFTETDFSAYPALPVIVQQPVSTLAAVGGKATFTVVAQGVGLTYQWRKDGAPISGATKAALALTAITSLSEGDYDVIVSSATRQVVSSVATLTTVSPISITSPPLSQVVLSGQPVLLSVGLSSTAGATYQWLKNGVVIPGATSAHFGYSATQLFHGATYSVRIKNPAGSLVATAGLGIVLSNPSNLIQNVGKTLTLKAPVAGPGLAFAWELNGAPLVDDLRIKGSGKSTLTVAQFGDADVGAYTCVVSLGASQQESGAFNVAIRHIPVVNDFTPAPWIVSGDVAEVLTASSSPLKFSVSGLPPGVILNAALGQLSGKPTKSGDFTLKITATNEAGTSAVKLASVTVLPLDSFAVGAFEGLIQPNNPALTTNRNGGALKITVTSIGTLTGSVVTEGVKVALSGRLNSSTAGLPAFSITNTRGVAFTLTGTIAADGKLSGNLVSQSETVAAEAWRAGLTLPHPWVGTYNAAFSIDPLLAVDPAYPLGHGLLVAKVDAAGNVKWTGTLAEGTAITGSSKLGTTLRIPFHHQLYRPGVEAGSINGWLALSESSGERFIQSDPRVDWPMKWRKPQQTVATRSYRAGFASHTQTLQGGLYLATQPVLTLTGNDPNATLQLTQGKIELNPLTPTGLSQSIKIDSATLAAAPSGAIVAQTAISVKLSTGVVSGQFVFSDPDPRNSAVTVKRTTKFNGLLIPGSNKALGFFNLADLPTALPSTTPLTSPIWSGRLRLDPTL